MATLEQLESALVKADQAGNVDDARAFAAEIRRLREQSQAAPAAPKAPAAKDPTEGMSGSERFWAGAGKAVHDTGLGLGQVAMGRGLSGAQFIKPLLDRINPQASEQAFTALSQPMRDLNSAVAKSRVTDAPLADTAGGTAGSVAGNIAMLAIPGGAAGKAPTLGARLGLNAALGAASGAMAPVTEDESRTQNAVVGGALGLGGSAVGEGLGALASRARSAIDPVKQQAVQLAQRSGIPLHISQLSDSIPVKTMASMAKYLPFSGAGKAAANQQQAFNRAVGQTFGADSGKLTDEVMKQARQSLSRQYEEIYARNEVPLTPDALGKLASVETDVAGRLTQDEAAVIRKQLDRILGEVNESGALTGQKYQALRSKIMLAEGGDRIGSAVKEVRKALDDIAEKAVGSEDAAKLKQLRSQWANMRTTEDLLKQVAGANGDVSPARLWAAVRNGSTGEMRDLARLGQTVLKDPIPDSGTAGRLLSLGALGTGSVTGALPGIAGLIGAGATVGRALNSPTLARLVANRTPGTGLAALARGVPMAALAGVPVAVSADAVETKPRKRLDNR